MNGARFKVMKAVLLSTLLTAALLAGKADACAFHGDGFGMGSFGSRWTPYDSELLEEARRAVKESEDAEAAASQSASADGDAPKPRPAFATAASRAVETAKARSSQRDDKAESTSENADDSAN